MKELHLSIVSPEKEHIRRKCEDCHIAGNDRFVFYSPRACAHCLVVESGNVELYDDGGRRAHDGYSGRFCRNE